MTAGTFQRRRRTRTVWLPGPIHSSERTPRTVHNPTSLRPRRVHAHGWYALILLLLLACPAHAATISGFVRAAESGEALPYASVEVPGLKRGTLTNASGFYVITGLAAGSHEFSFACLGYRAEARTVTLVEAEELTLTLELVLAPQTIEGVEVKPDRSRSAVESGKLQMDTADLTRTPAAVEADVFRAVQTLPGVSTLSDFSAGLYVRGGSPDQNLILLDEIDVYNPNHLFGFFSTFNVDAVKSVDLQKSGYPARYGGRLSSLLDVHNRDGNRKQFQGTAHASVIASSTTLEGPWSHGSWLVSGRHTYLETLARAVKIDLPYHFYDVQSRFNFDPGVKDRLSLSLYTGRDVLDWDKAALDIKLDWGNRTWSSQWTHVFNSRLFSRTVAGHSLFDSRTAAEFSDFGFHSSNRIEDLAFKQNLSWEVSAAHHVESGAELKALDFHFRSAVGDADPLEFRYRGTYGALYAQDTWRIDDRWRLHAGLRADHYDKGRYWRLDPRFTLERAMGAHARVHATYGRYHQFLNLVAQEGATFADQWFPVDATLAPGQADHYVVGAEFGPFESFDLSVELYAKPYRNVVEYSAEFQRSLADPNATMSQVFDSGTGLSRGADLYLRNRGRHWQGWWGYSFGNATRKLAAIESGREFHPTYDRRHQLVASQTRTLGKHARWSSSLVFRYGTGQPLTLPTSVYTVTDINGRRYNVVRDGVRNASRLPDYHRLDLGLVGHYHWHGWKVEPEVQIVNLYNHRNVYIRQFETDTNPAHVDDVTMLPFLPTLGVKVEF